MSPSCRAWTINPARRAAWTTVGVLLAVGLVRGAEQAWPDAELGRWLADGRRSSAAFVVSLSGHQGSETLRWYDIVGREEPNRNLGRRPILEPSEPEGPFARGAVFAARVDRARPVSLIVRLELVAAVDGGVRRTRPEQIRVRVVPGGEFETRTLTGGELTLTLPVRPPCGELDLELADGAERHRLTLRLLNRRAPVTVLPARPRPAKP